MTRRIFRSIVLASFGVLLACLGLIMGVVYSYFTRLQVEQLRVETALAAHALENEGIRYFDRLDGTMDCRITWIDTDGTVLYDNRSDSDAMENHLERSEVQDALRSGFGESSRHSATLMEQYIYAAERLPDGTVLRLSSTRDSVLTLILGMWQQLFLVIGVILLLSLTFARRLAGSIVKPLNELNLDDPLSTAGYEELKPLLMRLESQQRLIQGKSTELKRKQREFDTVIKHMNEGLVLMNDRSHVLTMNEAAARIMGLKRPLLGINFRSLLQAEPLEALLDTALGGSHGEQIQEIGGKFYQIDANPVKSGGAVTGVVLLMFDITQKHQAEAHRREFTANVSHELKTPLHAISGYAEMMKEGFVPERDVPAFSGRIYEETQRMVRLVEDILKLSHLEEDIKSMEPERSDLWELAAEAVRALESAAAKRDVRLTLSGDRCPMVTIPHLVSGIITNLCTNAIKYNVPGGCARVEVRDGADEAVLIVSDTGIGIAPEHLERIFERFYRVDKSRSKAVGGTGLGLSIVKHAAQILGASIHMDSTPGTGTTVTVRLPKKR